MLPASGFARVALLMLVAVLTVAGALSPRHAVQGRTDVEVDHDFFGITFNIYATVVGDLSEAAEAAGRWEKAFNDSWGKSGGWQISCWTVFLNLDINARRSQQDGRHTAFLVPVDRGDHFVPEANVWKPGAPPLKGWWGNTTPDPTIGHEFGHWLGLGDEYFQFFDKNGRRYTVPDPRKAPEYTWQDNGDGQFGQADVWRDDGDGLVESDEWFPPTVKPGETPSVMADSRNGQVLPRHIKEIVKKRLDTDELKCKWQGTLDYRTTLLHAHPEVTGVQQLPLQMTLEFEEDENGVLSGTGEAVGSYSYRGDAICGPVTENGEQVTFPILVSGNHTGDQMQLVIQSDGVPPGISWTGTNCDGSPIGSSNVPFYSWLQLPEYWPETVLTPHGEDRVYRYENPDLYHEQVYPIVEPYIDSTTSLIIEVKPVEDEDVPVG